MDSLKNKLGHEDGVLMDGFGDFLGSSIRWGHKRQLCRNQKDNNFHQEPSPIGILIAGLQGARFSETNLK